MRIYGLLLCGWMAVSLQAQQIHDWENHHVLQINREPARAAFVPFAKQKGDCSMSLDGMWKFRWTPVPSERIADFYRTDFNDEDWKSFRFLPIGKSTDTEHLFMYRQDIRLNRSSTGNGGA